MRLPLQPSAPTQPPCSTQHNLRSLRNKHHAPPQSRQAPHLLTHMQARTQRPGMHRRAGTPRPHPRPGQSSRGNHPRIIYPYRHLRKGRVDLLPMRPPRQPHPQLLRPRVSNYRPRNTTVQRRTAHPRQHPMRPPQVQLSQARQGRYHLAHPHRRASEAEHSDAGQAPRTHSPRPASLPHLRQAHRLHTPTLRPHVLRSGPRQTPSQRRDRHTREQTGRAQGMQQQEASKTRCTHCQTVRFPRLTRGRAPLAHLRSPSGCRRFLSPAFFSKSTVPGRGVF